MMSVCKIMREEDGIKEATVPSFFFQIHRRGLELGII